MKPKTTGALLCLSLMLAASRISSDPNAIEIVCQKSFFTPTQFTVKKAQTVRLVLSSTDVTHGFAIDEFGIAREIPAGPPTVIEFVPDRAGHFTYYCVVRCGKSHKTMRGTLIVE